ncbi:hypothetical protein VP1G_00678 [Cytospora mali]|uniref:Uncharacterized protein n=1 Tax=Cytospora mali TaxID=578113 RepID=A0A194UP24_CYTMA|nr:hypothetical protein VP1G_00678 [Valsa mali var. pyri (nom. inval.)]
MPRNTDTSELDINCNHSAQQICCYCRPDLFNRRTPAGTGFCNSPSAPNSANLTPRNGPHDPYRAMRYGTGQYYMAGACATPPGTSTLTGGQGSSNPQPIVNQQPGYYQGMQYPSTANQAYGTMGGYSSLAQSPAGSGSGAQGSAFYSDEEETEQRRESHGKTSLAVSAAASPQTLRLAGWKSGLS